MPDAQRIIQEVRNLLQSDDWTLTDRLRGIAQRYGELSHEVVQRLRRCEEFAFQGRRSEAVHLAELEPRLLDVLGQMADPSLMRWQELTSTYGLPAAARFEPAQAEAVNQAYAEAAPLEELLREHRRRALNRAPLQKRIALLRQLNKADPGCVLWPQQIKLLESTRLKELDRDFERAGKQHDSNAIVAVWQELTATTWLAPADALLAKVQASATESQRRQARLKLREIAVQLPQAVKARDLAGAQQLRASWESTLPLAELTPGDALEASVAKPFDWISDMEFLVAMLERPNATTEQLANQMALFAKWQRYLPPNLENAYHGRMQELENVDKLKQRKILILAYVAIGVLAVLITIWLATLN